jgi:hypothetical protein
MELVAKRALPAETGGEEARSVMSENDTRLQLAEERLDKVQAVLDEVRRVLTAAEKAQAAAERGRTDLRKVNLVVLASAAILAVIVVVSRKAH